MSDLTQDLGAIFLKEKEFGKDASPFLLNRFVSMDKRFLKLASRIDRFCFLDDKTIALRLLKVITPKQTKIPWLRYIKKPKGADEEFDFLFERMQKYFEWSDSMMKFMKPYYITVFNRKGGENILQEHMLFFGADRKKFKKYKIKLEKPVKKEAGMTEWFK